LNSSTYQAVPISCPNCSSRFVSPVLTIIDVGQNPEVKALFLSGQINVAVCPQCGHAGVLSTPLVYHDPEKELLFTYIPVELGLSELEQQRAIGELTNRVLSVLPAEQRKGYLLRPRSFLRLQGMIEAILEADGITPEMMEAQRAKAALLERLMQATSDDARRTIVLENEAQIDYEFFQLLTLNIELAQAGGQEKVAAQLLGLRRQLLNWTATGREVASRQEAIRELGTEITREGLLEKLVRAALAGEQAKVETMVAIARPAIDYIFYQQLTEQIDAAEKAGNAEKVQTLRALRQTILELTDRLDAELQQAAEEADQLLRKIMASDDLEKAVRANLAQMDELFLSVLATNIEAAEASGQPDKVKKLQEIGDTMLSLIQESQPPEIQFINRLLAAEYPDGTQALLADNSQLVTADLLEIMQLVEKDLAESDRVETAQQLAQIRDQVAAMLG
jgi:hypothetical protein